MRLTDPQRYDHLGFEVHPGPRHKYRAVLIDKHTKRIKRIPFGGKHLDGRPYPQYRDRIGYYSAYDHHDKRRRAAYHKRHIGEADHKYSSGYFAAKYLW